MWEKELELIESLGKLYPKIYSTYGGVIEYNGKYQTSNFFKAWWVCYLCLYGLEQRLPRLEKFIKENNESAWEMYITKPEIKKIGGYYYIIEIF